MIKHDFIEVMPDMLAHQAEEDYMLDSAMEANLLLLLLSSDFFANDTLIDVADMAIDMHEKNIKTVIPIVCRKFFSDMNEKILSIPMIPANSDIHTAIDKDAIYAEISRYVKVVAMLISVKLENIELKKKIALYEK